MCALFQKHRKKVSAQLFEAIRQQDVKLARTYVEDGAEMDFVDKWGDTALHQCAVCVGCLTPVFGASHIADCVGRLNSTAIHTYMYHGTWINVQGLIDAQLRIHVTHLDICGFQVQSSGDCQRIGVQPC